MKSDRGDIELAGVCKSFDGATYVVKNISGVARTAPELEDRSHVADH